GRARRALALKDFSSAEHLALQIPAGDPLWTRSRLVAGEAATRAQKYDAAIEHYRSIPGDEAGSQLLVEFSLGEVYRHVGELSRAEACYEAVLKQQPGNATAHSRMAFLLGVTGRRWETLPHYRALLALRTWTLEELVLLADLERPLERRAFLDQCAKRAPDDVLVLLGLAVDTTLVQGRAAEGRQRLQDVVSRRPELLTAQALLGEMLVDVESDFEAWHAALPPLADQNADIWLVRGLWFRRQGQLEVAARCFWEAVRRAPSHRRANYQLGQILMTLDATSAREFAERAADLFELTQVLDTVLLSQGQSEPSLKRATFLLKRVGRTWEAWAWAETARRQFPQASWPDEVLAEVVPLLMPDSPLTQDSHNLALRHNLSHFPLPGPLPARQRTSRTPTLASTGKPSIRFEDEAGPAGLRFVYDNGDEDVEKHGARMFEQTGGGVAVIDYDGDGWPDLFFAQGCRWPHGSSTPELNGRPSDCLFRNDEGRGFSDVTLQAAYLDGGFGQGAAVGDYDNDGFPDLYVGHIGRNHLHRNNGDGTFSDVSEACGLQRESWTTSCVIVDLNADGNPDLFDVTYLDGPQVFERLCKDGYACSPKNFGGVPDHLLISRGDGTFEDIPGATPAEDSKGLGVVAVDLHERGRPSLFVANDQVPNFLLENRPSDAWPGVRFVNEGFLSGLAYNENGLAMASMGIAAGDADGNGRLDFFVTNFREEADTLYLQDAAGQFRDATKISGLYERTLTYVGWGTQFLDADLDGHPDVVLVNGHVDDYRATHQGYHMPAQLFRNTGNGRFVELSADRAGSFFEQKSLGRGLARLDWNRDGRMDFAVSNMNSPASLATNRTEEVGRFLNVRLIATRSARDAIGAVVRVFTAGREYSQQLVAGDGYMASNERILQFGLGAADAVSQLQVRWPSGTTTTVHELPVDGTIRLVEDKPWALVDRGADSITVNASMGSRD
ncbi:MAG TPA: FG-GAP-like repeat-containing protein, partial [Planctomycetaceae bacterium]|nr:FG-GAP-like repeat-containing protein [Planctomycetaceae bacterium]